MNQRAGNLSSLFFVSNPLRLLRAPARPNKFFSKNYSCFFGAGSNGTRSSARSIFFTSNSTSNSTWNNVIHDTKRMKLQSLSVLKSSLFPIRFGYRGMATHRDLGYRGRSNGGGPGNSFEAFFQLFKIPFAFTGAVILANSILMPLLLSIPGVSYLKRRPDLVIYGLIGINLAGFLAWKSPIGSRFMYRYGMLHKDGQFNVLQMLGSAFSHQEIWHFGLNMFALYQFGLPVARWLGSDLFLQAYLDSAVIASLGSLLFPVLARHFTGIPSLGASGAIFSMFGIFSFLSPASKVFLFFIPIPLNTMWVFLGSMLYSCGGLLMRRTMFDHAGHLGGCVAGLGWGYYLQQKVERERQKRRSQIQQGKGRFW